MAPNSTAYMITIGEINIDGIMADEFEESLIFVGRLIEQLNDDENYLGKYIYVVEYMLVKVISTIIITFVHFSITFDTNIMTALKIYM